jgi:hypothetical protein
MARFRTSEACITPATHTKADYLHCSGIRSSPPGRIIDGKADRARKPQRQADYKRNISTLIRL